MACRLIVIATENLYPPEHPSAWMNYKKYRRGDVVSVLPAGQFPGKKVLNNPRFAVIDTDMTMAEAEELLEGVDAIIESNDAENWKRRIQRFALENLPTRFLADIDATTPITVSKEALRLVKEIK